MTFVKNELVGRVDFRAFYEGEGVKFRGEKAAPNWIPHTPPSTSPGAGTFPRTPAYLRAVPL